MLHPDIGVTRRVWLSNQVDLAYRFALAVGAGVSRVAFWQTRSTQGFAWTTFPAVAPCPTEARPASPIRLTATPTSLPLRG